MDHRDYSKFIAHYVLYYMSMVVLFLFLPVFFTQAGFGRTAVGSIMAVGPFVGLIAQPVWGTVAEKKPTQPKPDVALNKNGKLPASALAKQLALGISRIVIDPGHGGRDYGAPGYLALPIAG